MTDEQTLAAVARLRALRAEYVRRVTAGEDPTSGPVGALAGLITALDTELLGAPPFVANVDGGPKEQVYDRHIGPLVKQIIAIAEREKIATLMHFELDGALRVSTALAAPEFAPSEPLMIAAALVRRSFSVIALPFGGKPPVAH